MTGGVPLQWYLLHDMMMHPSGRDVIWGWYAAMQQGHPAVAGSGCTAANYYQVFDYPQYPDMWALANGTTMPPGPGTSNSYATIQGGQPADGRDHSQYNQSPYLQGLVDFFSGSSPTPVQPAAPPSTRRWFAGLSRSAVRLGS